jgi:hypothetical protein
VEVDGAGDEVAASGGGPRVLLSHGTAIRSCELLSPIGVATVAAGSASLYWC